MTPQEFEGMANNFSNIFNIENLTLNPDAKTNFKYQLYNHFLRLAYSRWEYKNLPEGLKAYDIEKGLYYYGVVGVTKEPNKNVIDKKYLALRLAFTGGWDYNRNINISDLVGYSTGKSEEKPTVIVADAKDNVNAIFIRNTIEYSPTIFMIRPYIERLFIIWQSAINNTLMSNKKIAIKGKPEHKDEANLEAAVMLSLSPFIRVDVDREGYDDYADRPIEDDTISFNVDYAPEKYNEDYIFVYNQILNLLGVMNNPSRKKERNVVDEVNFDNIENMLFQEEMKEFRQEAMERMNKLYGSNASVDFRIQPEKEEEPKPEEKEEKEDDK